jgi:hypothetical protein
MLVSAPCCRLQSPPFEYVPVVHFSNLAAGVCVVCADAAVGCDAAAGFVGHDCRQRRERQQQTGQLSSSCPSKQYTTHQPSEVLSHHNMNSLTHVLANGGGKLGRSLSLCTTAVAPIVLPPADVVQPLTVQCPRACLHCPRASHVHLGLRTRANVKHIAPTLETHSLAVPGVTACQEARVGTPKVCNGARAHPQRAARLVPCNTGGGTRQSRRRCCDTCAHLLL